MTRSGHVDPFTRDRLPPRETWPDFEFALDDLHYPERLNAAWRFLDRHVEDGAGDRPCILSPDARWSYRDLFERANRIARVLVEDMGVESGNRVLLRGYNGPMLAAAWLAVIKAGAVAVTTMPLYRSGELAYMLEKAHVRHALCDSRLASDLHDATAGSDVRTVTWGDGTGGALERLMQAKPATFDNADTASDDVAVIGFTSGTTGRPKAAMHFHRDLLAVCDTYAKRVLRASPADVFCGSPPLGFTFGLGGLLLFPLDAGASTLLLEKAQPQRLMEAIERFRATVVFTAPVAYRSMLELLTQHDVGSLRTCVSAGETLPASVWRQWYERTGLKIMDGIGSTEMFHIFIGSPAVETLAGSTGRVVPGYRAEIHDDAGAPVATGIVGRLAVKGPTGCRYLDDERQKSYVSNGWNYPGDAYRVDADGYFWYVARADDMIISAGYNISGPEVEAALLAHDEVVDCAVVAKPDPERETQVVKAYVVLRDPSQGTDALLADLQTFVKTRIATYKCPREIEFVGELPRTETGKVQRYRLRAKAAAE